MTIPYSSEICLQSLFKYCANRSSRQWKTLPLNEEKPPLLCPKYPQSISEEEEARRCENEISYTS